MMNGLPCALGIFLVALTLSGMILDSKFAHLKIYAVPDLAGLVLVSRHRVASTSGVQGGGAF